MAKVDITRKGFRCLRCKYEWIPRFNRAPKLCPNCRSDYWNKPRVRKRTKLTAKEVDKVTKEITKASRRYWNRK